MLNLACEDDVGEFSCRSRAETPRLFRSSRSNDFKGETLMKDDKLLVEVADCRRTTVVSEVLVVLKLTGPLRRDFSSSSSCLMGIKDTEGVIGLTSGSALTLKLLLTGVLELESADCGELGQSTLVPVGGVSPLT